MPLSQHQRFHFSHMWHHAAFFQTEQQDVLRLQHLLQRGMQQVTRMRSAGSCVDNSELKPYGDQNCLITLYTIGRPDDFYGSVYSNALYLPNTFTAELQYLLYRQCVEKLKSILRIDYHTRSLSASYSTIRKILTYHLENMIPEYRLGYSTNELRDPDCEAYVKEYSDILRHQIDANIRVLTRLIAGKFLDLFAGFHAFRDCYFDYWLLWLSQCHFILSVEYNLVSGCLRDQRLSTASFRVLRNALQQCTDPVNASIQEYGALAGLHVMRNPFCVSHTQWNSLADLLIELKAQYNLYASNQQETTTEAVKASLMPRYLNNPRQLIEHQGLFGQTASRATRYRLPRSLRRYWRQLSPGYRS